MPASYSYKVRVLAALDAHYNPQRPLPISLQSIDSKYESDCNANRVFLPSTWRKRVKIILDRLVAEGFLVGNNNSYSLTPRLRTLIADEKVRLNVNHRNHEWRVFAGVAKKLEAATVPNGGNAAPSSTPAGRTRNRTSLSASDVRVVVASSAPVAVHDNVSTQSRRRIRHSDPGPFLSKASSSSSTIGNRKRRSIGTSSSDIPSASNVAARPTSTVSPHRRRSVAASRNHRRHTFAVVPIRHTISSVTPEPISQEIQFFPLKQALSARTRRALRRNALSEEMNNIDAEKRAGLKKNREELARLRAELAESTERLRELERELAAARYAPSEEPEPLPPINEAQEDGEDYNMGYISAGSPEPEVSLLPGGESQAPEVLRVDMEIDEAPPSHRDQKIKDLESMIEALRHDIAQRAEEERLRAQEDEVFHDAEEQILHEENHALAERIEELTAIKGKTVSFDDGVEEIGPEEEEEDDDDDSYLGPLADDFEDGATDIEDQGMAFHSSGPDSGIRTLSQKTRVSARAIEVDKHAERNAELEAENNGLRRQIDTMRETIQEMEENIAETRMSSGELEKATSKLKRENEKLRRLEKELEGKIIELEEMEGERLENVGHMMVQTDEVVDWEKVEMEQKMESLAEQVVELQEMVAVVAEEKRGIEGRITAADLQISTLTAIAESGSIATLEAQSQISTLMEQIADLQDTKSEENREAQRRIDTAAAQVADLKLVAEASEAAKARAEARIGSLMDQVKELEIATSEERSEAKARILELEEAVESGEVTRIEFETQTHLLMDRLSNHDKLASEMRNVARAQITDLEAVIESGKVEKAKTEARVVTLMKQVEDLESNIAGQRREVDVMIATSNSRIADLHETIEASKVAQNEAESRILELKSQIEEFNAHESVLAREKDEMEKEIDQLTKRVDELEVEIGELREENVELKEGMTALVQKGNEFEKTTQILKHDKAALGRNVRALEEKVDELEDAAMVLKSVNLSLETDFANLNGQLISQQKATELAEKTREKFERNVVELRSHIEAFERAADISKHEKESFERDITSLRAQVSSLEASQALTGCQNQDLQRDIDELNAQIGSFQQAIETASHERDQLEDNIAGLSVQIEALKKAGKAVQRQKEALEETLTSLGAQLANLSEELGASRAENNLFKQEISNHKSEIESLKQLLELSNRENDALHHEIQDLAEKVVSLEDQFKGSNEENLDLHSDIDGLRSKIKTLEQASEVADEEKFIIQEKIRPYIQGGQSLDMAVEEVLTELVMAKNRADENERIKIELSNKIQILAQEDDTESTNPEEIVERLTARFKEVRKSVEKLYEFGGQARGGAFDGYDLGDFAWIGSNESALMILGRLVEDLYKKVTNGQARAEELKEGLAKEKEQRKLYGGYLDDIAVTVRAEGQDWPGRGHTLSLVTLRLSALKQQIEATEERVEELNDSVSRKNNTIKDLELNIDNAGQREMELNKKLVDSISAYNMANTRLEKSRIDIEELGKVIDDKDEEIDKLETTIDEQTEKERELLDRIERQAISHCAAVVELETKRDEAVADVQRKLADMRDAKINIERLADQAREENELVVNTLRGVVAALQTKIDETHKTLKTMRDSHQEIVERLEGRLAQGRGELSEVSRKLDEAVERSTNDILALEIKLKASQEEFGRQKSSLKRAFTERDNVAKQLDAEIQSSQDAITRLEEQIRVIRLGAQDQHEVDQKLIDSLKTELQTAKNSAEGEKKVLQEKIQRQAEEIGQLKDRIGQLEEIIEEVEDSEKALEEHLKAAESQSQLFQEETAKAQQALEAEKKGLQFDLVELKRTTETTQTQMQADITTLKALVEEKSLQIQKLEAGVSVLHDERSKLEETVNQLEKENGGLEDALEKNNEEVQSLTQRLTNELNKTASRVGDEGTQLVKKNRLRQAERLKNRLKRSRVEQDDHEMDYAMGSPPTPAASVVTVSRKRGGKRRKYDSGIGVEDEDEEVEGLSQVGA